MSLLDMPVAASITISRSRPDSGLTGVASRSPGVAVPSQVAASVPEPRNAAVAARRSPAWLNTSAALDAASAASSMAPSASKSSDAAASSPSRAEVSSPVVRSRSCSSQVSAVRCPVAAARAAARAAGQHGHRAQGQ